MSACVYILLPVHNRCEITRKFIDSLVQQSYQNYHLLLIDDGSTDGTADMVRELVDLEKLTVLTGKGDWWWAGSLQQGINCLKEAAIKATDVVLIINDDVTFKEYFLEKGIAYINSSPQTLLLARYYDRVRGMVSESGVKADMSKLSFVEASNPDEINCLSTRGLFMSWSTCKKIGSFHVWMLPHYTSDYEFTMRAGKKGFKLKTEKNIFLTPDHSTTGIHSSGGLESFWMLFSKRYVMNPIYWTSFVLLASPIKWIPLNLMRVWYGALRNSLAVFFK